MDDHEQQESEISLLKSMYTEEELMFAKFYKESNSAIVDEVDANSFTLNLVSFSSFLSGNIMPHFSV